MKLFQPFLMVFVLIVVTTVSSLAANTNIALNKGITTSSEHSSGSYPGINAVDGNNSGDASRWVSGAIPSVAAPQWIEIDLGGTAKVSSIKFWTGYAGYNTPMNDFKFQRWDGTAWQDVVTETGNALSTYEKAFTEITTTKVRLFITKNDGTNPIRLYEIEVWGEVTIPAPTVTSYYVSPTGNDNNPGTLDLPFLTLEKARSAMRSTSAKTTYLRAGTYSRSETFILGPLDNGTTWQRYASDSWNSVILDGNGIQDIIDILGGNNITIDGLTLRNYSLRGIGVHGGGADILHGAPYFNLTHGVAYNNKISNCIIENGTVAWMENDPYIQAGWSGGGVYAIGSVKGIVITHNLVQNTTGYGIQVKGSDISNAEISSNAVLNVFRGGSCDDGGAIYIIDPNSVSTNLVIKNNFIRDYAEKGVLAWGIYLDNNCSNVTVQGNIVSGQGGRPVHIHGGKNNLITCNILDNQNQLTEVLSYANAGGSNPMSGNVISNNIILSRVNSTFTCYNNGSGDQFPEIKNNFYKNYGTAAISYSGLTGLTDSNPVTGDPLISGSTSYDIASNSPVFAAPVSFPPLVKGWGPAGYTLPADYGSTPSWFSPTVSGVSIDPSATFLASGGKHQLFANVMPWNASNQSISSWTSSNPSVATVSSTGLITGVTAGTANITVTTQEGSKTGSCIVTVLEGVSNVALYKNATTRSNFSSAYTGSKAVDGDNSPNVNSRWVSAVKPLFHSTGVFDPQWLEVDLGGNYSITAMKTFSGVGYDGLYSKPNGDFKFQRWDGSDWVDILNVTCNRNPMYAKTFPAVTTSKVRLFVTFTMDEVRLFELEVFGVALGISSFTVDDNNSYAVDGTVNINNTVFGTPTHYMISESSTFGSSVWQPYTTNFNYTLTNTSTGLHTLYFKVKYDSGESSVVSKKFYLKAPHAKGNPSIPQGIISPNPVSNMAKLRMVEVEGSSLKLAPSQEYEVSFFSITGQLIRTGKHVGSEFDFDLSDLPSGNILVKIQGKEGCTNKMIMKK